MEYFVKLENLDDGRVVVKTIAHCNIGYFMDVCAKHRWHMEYHEKVYHEDLQVVNLGLGEEDMYDTGTEVKSCC